MKSYRVVGPVIVFCLICLTSLLQAQRSDRGIITGIITDPSGSAVQGATVKVRNEGTAVDTVLTTNDAGAYTTPPLVLGTYSVIVDHEGFNDHVHRIAAKMARRSSASLAFMKLMSTPASITREVLDLEIDEAARLIVGADAQEGIAAFLGKREPNFAGAPAR